MTTLEELARKHGTIFIEEKSPGIDRVAFTFDQLRALIKEVVGEPVGYAVTSSFNEQAVYFDEQKEFQALPAGTRLHALKVTL